MRIEREPNSVEAPIGESKMFLPHRCELIKRLPVKSGHDLDDSKAQADRGLASRLARSNGIYNVDADTRQNRSDHHVIRQGFDGRGNRDD